jgi:SAM-dependent methyltransferase
MVKKIKRALFFIKTWGFHTFVMECIDRITDRYYEMYFNIETTGYITTEQLKSENLEWGGYGAVYYRYMINTLGKLQVDIPSSTFLDYGSGKGRALAYAASCNYKKIIGVENSKPLIKKARENIKKMKHRRTSDIVFEECDAQNYKIPSSVNIIYMYKPFQGLTLERVIDNIQLSFNESPRKIFIIFWNDDEFEKIISNHDWITQTYHSKPHLHHSHGIYETQF